MISKVLVVGGGVGGMSAALALTRRGIEVELADADPQWRAYGAGISVTGLSLRGIEETLAGHQPGDEPDDEPQPDLALRPVTFELTVKDRRATGELRMGASSAPIDAELEGELFADGAGAAQVIATLPLAEGYTTTYRTFELQARRVQNVALSVAGTEQVTVPAGTFETWKVVLTSPEDGSETHVFVDRKSRVVAKTWTKAPSLGGAVITSVLTK